MTTFRSAAFHLPASPAALVAILAAISASAVSDGQEPVDEMWRIETFQVGPGQKALLVQDFDGDGFLDLAIALQDQHSVLILRGDGRGGFSDPADFPAGPAPSSLASADFDGDGQPDLAVANHETAFLTLLLNDGVGGLRASPHSPLDIVTAPHSHMIGTADFNGDGVADILVDSRDRLGAFILLGLGDGRFDAPGTGVDVGGSPYLGLAIGDLDGDGAPDLAAPIGGNVSLLTNTSTGGVVSFEPSDALAAPGAFATAVADFDGDGSLELVVAADGSSSSAAIFARSDAGRFERQHAAAMPSGAKSIAVGDVNADGVQDAIITSWNDGLLLMLGGATAVRPLHPPLQHVDAPWGAAAGDFDRDGRDEFVIGDGEGDRVAIYRYIGD